MLRKKVSYSEKIIDLWWNYLIECNVCSNIFQLFVSLTILLLNRIEYEYEYFSPNLSNVPLSTGHKVVQNVNNSVFYPIHVIGRIRPDQTIHETTKPMLSVVKLATECPDEATAAVCMYWIGEYRRARQTSDTDSFNGQGENMQSAKQLTELFSLGLRELNRLPRIKRHLIYTNTFPIAPHRSLIIILKLQPYDKTSI